MPIARTARWTRWLVTAILIAAIALQLATYFPAATGVGVHHMGGGSTSQLLGLVHSALMFLALLNLILLLRALEKGDLFAEGVTRRLRAFALLALIASVVGGVIAPLVAALMNNCPAGATCSPRIPLDMRVLWTVITSFIFFLVARLLDEARRIDEDHRQII